VGVITEDREGHLYVATAQGLDQLDPVSGNIKHFTTRDGLASGDILAAYCAPNGSLWFGTTKGLSRFIPAAETPKQTPPIRIVNVFVAGARQNISVLGETSMGIADLPANQNQLEIDFVGLSFAPGEVLQYQYRLEGANANWSTPTNQRTVNFANLAPGPYRFDVRAINSDGLISSQPATITFRVLRPIWLRWWFLSLAALAVAGVAFVAYRYRVRRLVELERVRTRIATDLHDDIGANLTRISLLSELARQQRGNGNLLTSITDIARESVSSMNDIVWAISPEHDRLLDLTRRMRRHAEDVFALRDVKLNFNAPATDAGMHLRVSIRRDVLLIFKEAVNNAARHSQCTEVSIKFECDRHLLRLQISDNGEGFELNCESAGHGLRSMERRATSLGGTLRVESQPKQGTTVKLNLPLPRASYV
jgi:signal transduction histidine kinase